MAVLILLKSRGGGGNYIESDCSSSLLVDQTHPAAPIPVTTTPGTIANLGYLTTTWSIPGANTDLAFQQIQFFNDGTGGPLDGICDAGEVTKTAFISSGQTSYVYSDALIDSNTYFYIITDIDGAGNQTGSSSACTGPIIRDTVAPAPATFPANHWKDGGDIDILIAYNDGIDIKASWTTSGEASENITYYTDSSCSTAYPGGSFTGVTSADANLLGLITNADNGTTFYYKITSLDGVGNPTPTVCSNGMEVRLSQIQLTDTVGVTGDQYGSSVSIYGTIAAVGAPGYNGSEGKVLIYKKDGGAWSLDSTILGTDNCGAAAGSAFGTSVSVDVSTLVIGMPDSGNSTGAACVYKKISDLWTFQIKLTPSAAGTSITDLFGTSVSISGATIIIGAPGYTTNQGAAFVYEDTGTWAQHSQIDPSINAPSTCVDVTSSQFGKSVAVDSINAVIGAPFCDTNIGAAFFYEYDGIFWNEEDIENGIALDQFGSSVAIDGANAVVGAPGNETITILSHLIAWDIDLDSPMATGLGTGQGFGSAVGISGNIIAVGAPQDTVTGAAAGAVYYFTYDGDWTSETQVSEALTYNPQAGDLFGSSISVFGDSILIGTPSDDISTTNEGGVYIQKNN